MKKFNRQILFCLAFFALVTSKAQYAIGDLDLDGDISEWYDETNNIKNSELLEGPSFTIQHISPITHQFFIDKYWEEGTITIAGQTFNNVAMLYDIDKDLLLLKNISSNTKSNIAIRPNQDKIQSFIFHGAYFKNYQAENKGLARTGFYEVLAEGKTSGLIVKRIKPKKVNDTGFKRGIMYYDI